MTISRRMPCRFWLWAIVAILSCATARADDAEPQPDLKQWISKDASWALRLDKNDKVVYHGAYNFDNAGARNGSGMMYPAPGAAGLMAAIITHGILVDATRNNEKNRLEQVADAVLVPYQSVLSAFDEKELMQRGLTKTTIGADRRLLGEEDKADKGLVVSSEPTFTMTQDQTALVLDNTVSVFTPDDPSKPAYQNTVRVVSGMATAQDLVQYWTANQGERLKDESAALFAKSLDLALAEIGRSDRKSVPYKTVRYMEGTSEQMERGQVIAGGCGRVVIKNLRGWLMSVPVRLKQEQQESGASRCDLTAASAL